MAVRISPSRAIQRPAKLLRAPPPASGGVTSRRTWKLPFAGLMVMSASSKSSERRVSGNHAFRWPPWCRTAAGPNWCPVRRWPGHGAGRAWPADRIIPNGSGFLESADVSLPGRVGLGQPCWGMACKRRDRSRGLPCAGGQSRPTGGCCTAARLFHRDRPSAADPPCPGR